MHFGVSIIPADYAIDPVSLGQAAEDLGFESLFLPEHSHIPVSRRTPFPSGPELPDAYRHVLDVFVSLGAVAAATRRLRLGTSVCLLIERDPIVTAKQVASLDHLSGGRVIFGVGGGWNLEEMEDHGTNPKQRWKILRERCLALKEIWTRDAAEFHGEHVDFDPIWQWPKPAQKPHPPILVGGNGPRTLQRVVTYGDGWIPSYGHTAAALAGRVAELNDLAAAAGRGPLPVTLSGAPIEPAAAELARAAGVERVIFRLPPVGADQALPLLEKAAEIARRFT